MKTEDILRFVSALNLTVIIKIPDRLKEENIRWQLYIINKCLIFIFFYVGYYFKTALNNNKKKN